MAGDNGNGKNLKKRKGGRRPRNMDAIATAKVFALVCLVHGGMSQAQAYKQAYPNTKAKRSTWSKLGGEIMRYFETHYESSKLSVFGIANLGMTRLAQEVTKSLAVKTAKDVYEERMSKIIMSDGAEIEKPISVRVTVEAEDNATQQRGRELLARILDADKPTEDGGKGPTYNVIMNQQLQQMLAVIGPTMNDEKQAEILKITGGGNGKAQEVDRKTDDSSG